MPYPPLQLNRDLEQHRKLLLRNRQNQFYHFSVFKMCDTTPALVILCVLNSLGDFLD